MEVVIYFVKVLKNRDKFIYIKPVDNQTTNKIFYYISTKLFVMKYIVLINKSMD